MFAHCHLTAAALGLAALGSVVTLPALAAGPATATATTTVPPHIMVVDADRIIHESKASKSIEGQIEAQKQTYQRDIAKKEDELRSASQDLAKQQGQIPAAEFNEKRQAFEKRVTEVQREVEGKRRALEQGAGEAYGKIKRALVEIVQAIAEERSANLVLQSSQLILFEPGYDASREALEKLDQKLSTVQLVIPKPQDQAAAAAAPPKRN